MEAESLSSHWIRVYNHLTVAHGDSTCVPESAGARHRDEHADWSAEQFRTHHCDVLLGSETPQSSGSTS